MNKLIQKILLLCCVITLSMVFVSCSNDKSEQTQATTSEKSGDSGKQSPTLTEPGPEITGKVMDIIEGGGFTYVSLEHDGEKNWVAIPGVEVKKGEEITLFSTSTFPSFYSKTLKRTFENIIFAGGVKGKSPKGRMVKAKASAEEANGHTAAEGQMTTPATGDDSFADAVKAEGAQPMLPMGADVEAGSAKAVVAKEAIKVDRAPGSNGYTIGELFAKAAALDGQKIVIIGKVVKVSPGIMGRNWVHLQDGTGDSASQSHDLVVTSNEMTEMDKIVSVEGILRANKDFGSGYKYAVIVEDAKFTEK